MKLSDFKGLFHSDILTLKSSSNPFDDYWVFDFDTGTDTTWQAGEHGLFSFPEKIAKKQMRPMSIASIPSEGVLKIGTRTGKEPSAWKQKITSMQPGDKIKVRGPFGWFKIQDSSSPIVMIAGGIGITPFRGMMKQIANETTRDIVLVYSSNEQYLFEDEFAEMQKNNDRIQTHFISGRENLASFISEYVGEYGNNGYYYISGAPAMIKGVQAQLKEKGISKKRILNDSFQGY